MLVLSLLLWFSFSFSGLAKFSGPIFILSLHSTFTSSNTAIRSSELLTSYGLSILAATASKNIDTVMLSPTEFDIVLYL